MPSAPLLLNPGTWTRGPAAPSPANRRLDRLGKIMSHHPAETPLTWHNSRDAFQQPSAAHTQDGTRTPKPMNIRTLNIKCLNTRTHEHMNARTPNCPATGQCTGRWTGREQVLNRAPRHEVHVLSRDWMTTVSPPHVLRLPGRRDRAVDRAANRDGTRREQVLNRSSRHDKAFRTGSPLQRGSSGCRHRVQPVASAGPIPGSARMAPTAPRVLCLLGHPRRTGISVLPSRPEQGAGQVVNRC
jgi:hypothetical protein